MYCINQAVNYSVHECQAILEESSAFRCASVKLTPNYDTEFWGKVLARSNRRYLSLLSIGGKYQFLNTAFEVKFKQENNFYESL